uniref:UDP-glucose 6-dehydrogenase n=1 Tax=Cryptomonas curvata TaxID=233186 RepID=A0A7S0M456_9CRYP|mmetsp:Transcript_20081/g.42104  ORF Transcript_20081/g.42104 Transcript_20081/m.42104 type:complete len:489 (+) Transcript_20081:60-1526(+)
MERRQSTCLEPKNATVSTPEQFIAAFDSTTITSVGCIGSGRVGVCTMATMAKRIPNVKFTVFDDDPYVVCSCQTGPLPFYEPDLDDLVATVRGKNLFFTRSLEETVGQSQVVFVCINTPLKTSGIGAGQAADLSSWENAARRIAVAAKGVCKIVVESTTMPIQTGETMRRILDALAPNAFEVLSIPSFYRGGSALQLLESPERMLLGGSDSPTGKVASDAVVRLLGPWIAPEKIVRSNVWSAELAKLAQNAFIAQRITSVNAVSALCEKTGADLDEVMQVVSTDSRIGAGYLKACPGIGGGTLLHNIRMLVYLCRYMRLHDVADYWNQTVVMDEYQRTRFADNIVQTIGSIKGKRIAVLGFAYKPDTSRVQESPAIGLCRSLLLEGAKLAIYDPEVTDENVLAQLPGPAATQVQLCTSALDAVAGADALVLVTGWKEFETLDMAAVHARMARPAFVFDSRGFFDPARLEALGFSVYRIGKPRPVPVSR